MKLFLDDVRDPTAQGLVGWTWVKTYEEAIAALSTGQVVRASLDHDLSGCLGNACKDCRRACETAVDYERLASFGCPHGPKTGYDVVCWMVEHNCWPPEGVSVHSANPAGAQRMRVAIAKYCTLLPNPLGIFGI